VREGRVSPWYSFEESVQTYPDTTCIWSRYGSYTYQEAHDLACQYGHFFLSSGIQPGQLVAFYLQNRPEFLVVWLGLWSIGCAPAAVNFNLSGDAVVHCLKISGAKIVLVDEDEGCRGRIEDRRSTIEGECGMKIIGLDRSLQGHVTTLPTTPPDEKYRTNVTGGFPAMLLYTSGTTGMPKGCALTMSRFFISTLVRKSFYGSPGRGRWYNCMPLYHGTGAIMIMICLISGIPVAVGRKFSVSHFWTEIQDSQSTAFVYVGETARYLLAAPPSPRDRDHKVRVMYGNGLRADVWDKFRERFGVPEVVEFFSSTEGMLALINHARGSYLTGAVGHHGFLYRARFRNLYIPVATDPSTGDIRRDPVTGFAIREPYEKGGEILVAVPNTEAFQGYWSNPDATEKMFVRDVFCPGDLFYRSGDALRRTDDGRWYFLDRLGDSFRWKSENVSTAEVSEVLGQFPGVIEANVYGVTVPNHEGRAGCAALWISPEAKGRFDFGALARYARSKLPRYAAPVFVRVVEVSSHIHNNKQDKVPLREEGVDPAKVGTKVAQGRNDRFLYLPPGADTYLDFTQREWDRIVDETTRL
jgi:acyl-CoA synthetase (AMP-forming)/AMP-acid ligase II